MLALLGVVLHALAPAGYMLAPSTAHGQIITVTLCSGTTAHLDLAAGGLVDTNDDHQNGPDKSAGKDAPCVFAWVAPLAAPEAAVILAVRSGVVREAPRRIVALSPGRGLAAPPPWSTGPPLTA